MSDAMKPFADEESGFSKAGLTVENRRDRVVVYDGEGLDLTITRDRRGLERARVLARLMADAVAAMEKDPSLPEEVAVVPPTIVSDPFA